MIGPSGFQQAPKAPARQVIEVVERKTGEVAHSVDVTGKSDHHIEQCERGMLRNMSKAYFTRLATVSA